MIVNLTLSILGIFVFLFLFWKRLKEDYSSEIVFQSGTAILIGFVVGWVISKQFFPAWFFWASLFGGLGGLIFDTLKIKVRFYETLEAFVVAALPGIGFMFLADSVRAASLSSFLAFIFILLLVFVSYWLNLNYKSFSWYKSGRVGFTGLSTAVLFFFARTVLAILNVPVLSFVKRGEWIISGLLVIACLVLIYNLGKEKK